MVTSSRSYMMKAWTNSPAAPTGKITVILGVFPLKVEPKAPVSDVVDAVALVSEQQYAKGYNDGLYAALSTIQPRIDLLEEAVQASQAELSTGVKMPITIGHQLMVIG